MTRAWLTYVCRHAQSFSAGSRPNVNAVCKETTTARMPSSQSSTTSWTASSARTCAKKCPSHLRRNPQRRHNRSRSHSQLLRGRLSPFLFRCSGADHGTAVLPVPSQLAQSRTRHSPRHRHHPHLALSQPYAAIPLHSMPHPDSSHPRCPHPQHLSPLFRAYPKRPHRTALHTQRIPRWIVDMRSIERPSRGGKRKSGGRKLPLAAPRRKPVGERKPRPVTKKTRNGKTRRPRGACVKPSCVSSRCVPGRPEPGKRWSSRKRRSRPCVHAQCRSRKAPRSRCSQKCSLSRERWRAR
jgi:hypothetical protein